MKHMKPIRKIFATGSALLLSAGMLAACGSSNSLDETSGSPAASGSGDAATIVIGSQDYYSNEIIAEIYSQALEGAGFTVQRDFRIGQREVYMGEIENGSINLFPEYTGPLLEYWTSDYSATTSAEIYDALVGAAPDNLQILDQSEATDQDSYVVTREFAETNNIWSLTDLASYDGEIKVGGNSELESRPHGPTGLKDVYGADVTFTPIEDSGGPLTVKALEDGDVQMANIFSASPAIKTNDLVVLEDPEGLCLPANVVPVASADLSADAVSVVNDISAKLGPDDLVALNAQSVDEQASATDIAGQWLSENN